VAASPFCLFLPFLSFCLFLPFLPRLPHPLCFNSRPAISDRTGHLHRTESSAGIVPLGNHILVSNGILQRIQRSLKSLRLLGSHPAPQFSQYRFIVCFNSRPAISDRVTPLQTVPIASDYQLDSCACHSTLFFSLPALFLHHCCLFASFCFFASLAFCPEFAQVGAMSHNTDYVNSFL